MVYARLTGTGRESLVTGQRAEGTLSVRMQPGPTRTAQRMEFPAPLKDSFRI